MCRPRGFWRRCWRPALFAVSIGLAAMQASAELTLIAAANAGPLKPRVALMDGLMARSMWRFDPDLVLKANKLIFGIIILCERNGLRCR